MRGVLEIGSEQNSTIVFPLPIDLIGPLMQAIGGHGDRVDAAADPRRAVVADGAADGSPAAAIPG